MQFEVTQRWRAGAVMVPAARGVSWCGAEGEGGRGRVRIKASEVFDPFIERRWEGGGGGGAARFWTR